eukprot:c38942_g1_i1.p1 GENE.c38942_g1_i1~~c38942_g1_i1.p1  ORF type:complete len:648 (-),score=109.16 c38942_g1_i1:42-1985(-)
MVFCCRKAPAEAKFTSENMTPITNRKCRDLFFLFLFLASAGGSIWISSLAVKEGDLNRLRYGISTASTLCGSGVEANRPKLLFCFNVSNVNSPTDLTNFAFSVCAASCPSTSDELVSIYNDKKSEFVTATGISEGFWEAGDHLLLKSACVAPAVSLLNRCVYDASVLNSTAAGLLLSIANVSDPGNNLLNQASQMFMNAYSDLETTWYIILVCGVAGGVVFSFSWLQLLRFFAAPMVWFTVLSSFLVVIAIDVLLAIKAGYATHLDRYFPQGHGPITFPVQPAVETTWERNFLVLFWVFIGLTVIYLCLMIFMFNRIRLAIALVKEAADVMKTIPQILLTPLIPIVFTALFFFYCLFIGALLASCGTIANGTLQYDQKLRYSVFFHIFFSFWAMLAMAGTQSVVMGGVVATYYWTRDKSTISWPIFGAIYRTLRFHLGSVAFGSLVLNTVQFIKWALLSTANRIKKLGATKNRFIKYLVASIMCIVICVERFIKFLTKNAYIMIAVDGHSFCHATAQAWQLIMGNALRMTAVNVVSAYVFFLGKLVSAILCAISCAIWIQRVLAFVDNEASVSSVFAPSVCTFILAYIVSGVFFEIADFTIDTLMLCFCVDDQSHRETGGYFASVRLMKFMALAPKIKQHNKTEPEN